LTDRKQRVKIGSSFSSFKPMISGVPRGAVSWGQFSSLFL